MVADKKRTLICSECEKVFTDARGLGTHRARTHGIPGQSKSTVAYRKQKEVQELAAKAKAAPAPKPAAKKITRKTRITQDEFTGFNEAVTIAVAVSRVKELLSTIAYEADLPARRFTRRVIQHLHDSTVR